MDKERFEQIKQEWVIVGKFGRQIAQTPPENIKWLISTVEKQKKEIERYTKYINTTNYDSEQIAIKSVQLEIENARLRKALEFYVNPRTWREGKHIKGNEYEMPLANKDGGKIARKALNESK